MAQPPAHVWRNICYGDPLNSTLQLLARPSPTAEVKATASFGEQLQVKETRADGNDLWIQLVSGHWALARGAGVVNCVETAYWKRYNGRIPDNAFYGQNFPADMRSEGYGGSSDFVVVSCSQDGFWREVNLEMLCRDFSTATLCEGAGIGDKEFQEWVANYAVNVSNFGRGKRFVVIVKPTRAWRRFQDGCYGEPLETVKDNVGVAQEKELTWVSKVTKKLGIRWEDIEFISAFVFLRKYCTWSENDCKKAANQKLAHLVRRFSGLASDRCTCELQYAFWLWTEAFDEEPLSLKEEAAVCCSCLRWLARAAPQDRIQLDPIDALAAGAGPDGWSQLRAQIRQKAPIQYNEYQEEPLVATLGLLRAEVERLDAGQQPGARTQGDQAQTVARQEQAIQRLEAEKRSLTARVNQLEGLAQAQAASLAQAQAAQAGSPSRSGAGPSQPEVEPEVAAAPRPQPVPERRCYVVTASADKTAHMWELQTGRRLRVFSGHTGPLWSCILSRDRERLFTTAQDGTAKMWDVATGNCLRTYAGQRGKPNWAAVTNDRKYLITAVNDETAKVWQIDNGMFIKNLDHRGCVCSVVMSPDGKFLFSAEDNDNCGLGRKFSIPDFKQVCTFDGKNTKGLYSCALSGDGKLFFTASHDGTMKMFDAERGGPALHTFTGRGKASNVMTSPTAAVVFCGRDDDGDGIVQMFSTETRQLVRTFKGHQRGVSAMWVSPDGRFLLTASWDKTAKVWDVASGTCMLTYKEHSNLVQGIVCW